MSAPKRLLEDPATAEALKADLQAAANHQVSFDLAGGLAQFETSLANLGSAGGAAGGWSSGLLKLGALGVIGGALVAAGVALSGSNEPAPPAEAQATTTPSSPAEAEAPAPPPEAETQPALAIEDLEPLEEEAPKMRQAPAAPQAKPAPHQDASPAPTRDALLAEEVKQLRRIRSELSSNPSKALSMANVGHQRFSKGVLYQEREALALSALHRLGRRQELEQRGQRYLKAFPAGSFSGRVRQLLAN